MQWHDLAKGMGHVGCSRMHFYAVDRTYCTQMHTAWPRPPPGMMLSKCSGSVTTPNYHPVSTMAGKTAQCEKCFLQKPLIRSKLRTSKWSKDKTSPVEVSFLEGLNFTELPNSIFVWTSFSFRFANKLKNKAYNDKFKQILWLCVFWKL